MTTDAASRCAVLLSKDGLVRDRLAPMLERLGLALCEQLPTAGESLALVVLEVGDQTDLSQLVALRERWPEALVAGFLRVPDQRLWREAERGGCDLVTTRGAVVRSIPALLERRARGEASRFPLLGVADAAGRLGLVGSFPETPLGPVALFRVDARWCAIADSCPHAGARLSSGELDGTVLTCPGHGSQFDVRTGERLRGPADRAVSSLRVTEEAGQLWLTGPSGQAGFS